MPNTPALVGEGMAGLFAPKIRVKITALFAQDLLGAVEERFGWMKLQHAVTAASGSSPAYFFNAGSDAASLNQNEYR